MRHGRRDVASPARLHVVGATMIFRQLFDSESSTYTYLMGDPATRQAVLIDPVIEQAERDLTLVRELDLTLTHVFDTHVHADHITAAGVLRERTGCTVVGSERGAPCVNLQVRHGDELLVGQLLFRVLATPGHTDDSVSYLLGDRVFTGDALLIRANGRTDFQNGNAGQLHDSITRVLFALPDETLVYPGHDYKGRTVTTIGEEKRHNPRFAGKTREEFIHIMENLHLPPPKKLDVAVPANRACGKTEPSPQVA
jgi:sulfur dioxygenase